MQVQKKRLQLQRVKLVQSTDKLEKQARDAVVAGREDLARLALERKAALQQQVEGIDRELAKISAQINVEFELVRLKAEAEKGPKK